MANQHRRSHQQPAADDCTRPVYHHNVEAFADGARQVGAAHHEFTDNHITDNDVSHANDAAYGDNNASAYGDNNAAAYGHNNASAYRDNNASAIGDATSYGHARSDAGARGAY